MEELRNSLSFTEVLAYSWINYVVYELDPFSNCSLTACVASVCVTLYRWWAVTFEVFSLFRLLSVWGFFQLVVWSFHVSLKWHSLSSIVMETRPTHLLHASNLSNRTLPFCLVDSSLFPARSQTAAEFCTRPSNLMVFYQFLVYSGYSLEVSASIRSTKCRCRLAGQYPCLWGECVGICRMILRCHCKEHLMLFHLHWMSFSNRKSPLTLLDCLLQALSSRSPDYLCVHLFSLRFEHRYRFELYLS